MAENDGTDTYTIVLKSQPGGTVTITPTSSAPGMATFSPATLSFNDGNWDDKQTVTVTGKGAGSATISHAVTAGTTNYPTGTTIGGMAIPGVTVTVTADTRPRVSSVQPPTVRPSLVQPRMHRWA